MHLWESAQMFGAAGSADGGQEPGVKACRGSLEAEEAKETDLLLGR